jgi:hypothetical protein
VAPLDTSGPRRGGLRGRRFGRLVGVGDRACWPRARARFTLSLGGLALSSEQVAKIRWHVAGVVQCGEGGVGARSNGGMQENRYVGRKRAFI